MENIITVFKNIKDTSQPFYRSCDAALARIKNGESKELVESIRLEEDKTKRNILKQGLPSICFSGKFKRRKASELIEHSGIICLDFDGYDTKKAMTDYKKTLSKDKFSHAVFVSPSGKGLKVLVKIPREVTNHVSYFNALKNHYESPHFDISCKDVGRVCYESYDPKIYINEDSEEWTDLGVKEYKEVVRHRDLNTVPITDESKIVDILLHWWTRKHPMGEGLRNQNAYVLASALNDFGISKFTAMVILGRYEEKDFPMSEIKLTVDSAYAQVQNFGTKYYEDEDRLNSMRSDMRSGATKKDIYQQLDGMNIEKSMANQIADRLEDEVSGNKFWKKSDKGVVGMIHISFKRFLENNGFYKYNPEGSRNYVFVRVTNNLIDHTTDKEIKSFVLDYLLEVNDDNVYNYFADNTRFFKEDFLTLLGSIKVHFIDDEKDSAHLYFKNVAVRITPDNIEKIDYIDLGGYVWKDHVIDRDFDIVDDYECDFKRFLTNVSFSDKDRISSMESTVGYLLHSFKSERDGVAVILNDELISDNPEGGTGKGLIMKAVSQLKKVVVIDGKAFDFKKSFPYQLVSADTQVLVFDDVKNRFEFEKLFSVITEGITLEKKNKDAIKIPFNKSPKIGITTNYAIRGSGNSFDRRKWELELHQYYSKNLTPDQELGRFMFREWDDVEWSKFDNYMVNNLKGFLTTGLVKSEFVNLKIRKLSAQTRHEFIEWCGVIDNSAVSKKVAMLINGDKVLKGELYMEFVDDYPDFAPKAKMTVSRAMFYKWLVYFCIFKGQETPEEGRDNHGRWIRLRTKHEYEENGKLEI